MKIPSGLGKYATRDLILCFFFFLKKHNVLEFCLREASVLFKDLMMDKSIFLVLHGDSLKSLHLCT